VAQVDSLLAFWSHALGAVAVATVLLWQLRGWAAGPAQRLLLGGLLSIGVTFLFLRDYRATTLISLAIYGPRAPHLPVAGRERLQR